MLPTKHPKNLFLGVRKEPKRQPNIFLIVFIKVKVEDISEGFLVGSLRGSFLIFFVGLGQAGIG